MFIDLFLSIKNTKDIKVIYKSPEQLFGFY